MPYSMPEINGMGQADFVAVFGEVFEHTPAIAAAAWQQRPFATLEALHRACTDVVLGLSPTAQLALIQAHPDLGSKAKMAESSVQEQAGAGLNQLSAAEYEQLQSWNLAYQQKFGFPFIIAVKNHTKASILQAFADRLDHTVAQEQAQAIAEIIQIAYFRLQALVVTTASPEEY